MLKAAYHSSCRSDMPFVAPPPSLALEFQFDFHLLHNPTHVIAVHPLSNGTLKIYTFADVVPRIHELAYYLHTEVNASTRSSNQCSNRTPIIAILATLDAFTYFMVIMGILRAGMIAFPISPRFSPSVTAYLIDTVQPSHILTDERSQHLTRNALHLVQGSVKPCEILAPSFEQIFTPKHANTYFPKHSRDLHDIAYVIHSSSSSAMFPKTIHCSAHFMLKNAEVIGVGALSFCGTCISELAGELLCLYQKGCTAHTSKARSGFAMALLNPLDPSSIIPASPKTIFEGFLSTNPSYVYASPALIEIWAHSPKITLFLASIKTVITAGKRLNKAVGDALVERGVHINVAFGSTETGAISILSPDQGMDWEYFYAPPIQEFQFGRRPDGYYSLIVLSTQNRTLPVCNTTYAETPAYDPGDIFMKHPTKEHHYCVIGRSSDQIMLMSGEMVNPAPIEEIILRHQQIQSTLLFGHAQKYLGILIEPIEAILHDTIELEIFLADFQFVLDS
ncbi:hypothetical protein D9757_011397 [Collybiopsis confluens]|uniref:AMP-dependent synthetase/ligase domain-containing protein n=1 Tax=Collybiopsis confluens TaxID=2823264 RepID=A0A8H5LRI6_9AGAR|nr:hypothetical protein D9757_011397 [Collybiopsis confluens]